MPGELLVLAYFRIATKYIWPTINKVYEQNQTQIFSELKCHTVYFVIFIIQKKITERNKYDSPGYSAELCCVSGLDNSKNKIINISVFRKS